MRSLLVIGILVAITSSALAEIPANKAQNECATKAQRLSGQVAATNGVARLND